MNVIRFVSYYCAEQRYVSSTDEVTSTSRERFERRPLTSDLRLASQTVLSAA